mgnify:FL=1
MSRRLILSDNYLAVRDLTQHAINHTWEAKQQAGAREMKSSLRSDKFSYHSFSGPSRGAKFVSRAIKSSHSLQLKIRISCNLVMR